MEAKSLSILATSLAASTCKSARNLASHNSTYFIEKKGCSYLFKMGFFSRVFHRALLGIAAVVVVTLIVVFVVFGL